MSKDLNREELERLAAYEKRLKMEKFALEYGMGAGKFAAEYDVNFGTRTGRISSYEPRMHQMPKTDKYHPTYERVRGANSSHPRVAEARSIAAEASHRCKRPDAATAYGEGKYDDGIVITALLMLLPDTQISGASYATIGARDLSPVNDVARVSVFAKMRDAVTQKKPEEKKDELESDVNARSAALKAKIAALKEKK